MVHFLFKLYVSLLLNYRRSLYILNDPLLHLLVVANNFSQSTPSHLIPEPSTYMAFVSNSQATSMSLRWLYVVVRDET